MIDILNKFKSLAIGVLALSFFMVVTLGSCSTQGSGSEKVEASAEGEEHPAEEGDDEHPAEEGDDEHPTEEGDDEHPTDSTKTE